MGLCQAAAPLPLLLLCWAELIILCSSGSFQVIALKIPYLQQLKIIFSFLFIDLSLYLYDLPFSNISWVFKNNNLSFFLPSLIWLVYTALFNWVHLENKDLREEHLLFRVTLSLISHRNEQHPSHAVPEEVLGDLNKNCFLLSYRFVVHSLRKKCAQGKDTSDWGEKRIQSNKLQ